MYLALIACLWLSLSVISYLIWRSQIEHTVTVGERNLFIIFCIVIPPALILSAVILYIFGDERPAKWW